MSHESSPPPGDPPPSVGADGPPEAQARQLTSPAPPVFSPEQVTRLIQRAAELDAHGERLDAEELKRIAREAGIDGLAMQQAIDELLRGEVLPAPTTRPSAPAGISLPEPRRSDASLDPDSIVRSILLASGMGAVVGLVAAFAPGMAGLAVAGLIVFIIARAAQLLSRGAVLEFELQNFVAVLIFAFTFGPLGDVRGDDWAAAVFVLWLVSSVLGGLIVWYGGRSLAPGDASDPSPPLTER